MKEASDAADPGSGAVSDGRPNLAAAGAMLEADSLRPRLLAMSGLGGTQP